MSVSYFSDTGHELVLALNEIDHLRATIATLRALLREAAPKCDRCDDIATWTTQGQENGDVLICGEHRKQSDPRWRPYDLGVRIKAELERE